MPVATAHTALSAVLCKAAARDSHGGAVLHSGYRRTAARNTATHDQNVCFDYVFSAVINLVRSERQFAGFVCIFMPIHQMSSNYYTGSVFAKSSINEHFHKIICSG
jgi:hypothetical protein